MKGFPLSRLHTRLLTLVLLGIAIVWWPEAWRFLAPALSPFIAICSTIALRTVSFASLLAVPMLLVVVVRRRFWCRHMCPVGLVSEYCGEMRRRRPGAAADAHYDSSPGAGQKRRVFSFPPFTGRFLALATLGGALAGYPLFLWLDPLAIFSGFFNVLHLSASAAALLSMAALPVVMLISYLMPGTWCPKVCPLGAAQELLALAGGPLRKKESKAPSADWKSTLAGRRSFLALSIGAVAPVLIPDGSASETLSLRPPGSVDEKSYKGDCIRCGSCVRACPTGIIEPVTDARDLAGLLAPGLRFDGLDYCLQDCNLCGQVCPTGVIQPLELEPKNEHIIGIAGIDLSACLLVLDQECGVCVPRCPRGAIDEVFSPETYTTIVRVVPENCNGCGACVGICPEKVVKVVASPGLRSR